MENHSGHSRFTLTIILLILFTLTGTPRVSGFNQLENDCESCHRVAAPELTIAVNSTKLTVVPLQKINVEVRAAAEFASVKWLVKWPKEVMDNGLFQITPTQSLLFDKPGSSNIVFSITAPERPGNYRLAVYAVGTAGNANVAKSIIMTIAVTNAASAQPIVTLQSAAPPEAPPPTPHPTELPCLTCHAIKLKTPGHSRLGVGDKACWVCHDKVQMTMLKLANGTLVTRENAPKLCWQCHQDRYDAWSRNMHGRSDMSCTSCHDFRSPTYNPITPLPPPSPRPRSETAQTLTHFIEEPSDLQKAPGLLPIAVGVVGLVIAFIVARKRV